MTHWRGQGNRYLRKAHQPVNGKKCGEVLRRRFGPEEMISFFLEMQTHWHHGRLGEAMLLIKADSVGHPVGEKGDAQITLFAGVGHGVAQEEGAGAFAAEFFLNDHVLQKNGRAPGGCAHGEEETDHADSGSIVFQDKNVSASRIVQNLPQSPGLFICVWFELRLHAEKVGQQLAELR